MIIKFTVNTTKIMKITHLRKNLNLSIFLILNALLSMSPWLSQMSA